MSQRLIRLAALITLSVCTFAATTVAQKTPQTITVALDATDAPRKILHARLNMPVTPGPLTLLYPKWIPGEHAPDGPVDDLTGLHFFIGGKEISWRRDLTDVFTFHLDIPAGASELEIHLDFVSPATFAGGFSSGSSITDKLAVISWNQVVLYPSGFASDDLIYSASLKLPAGWKFGTALPIASQGSTIQFAPASLTTLVDSPIIAGEYFRAIDVTGRDAIPHELDLAADSNAALALKPDFIEDYKSLVSQSGKLFGGARHYRDYHFLMTLSDHVAHFGLEHHESNDSRLDERTFVDEDERKQVGGFLGHEYFHSWNGKYRRPARTATPEYQTPMQGDLLWVYEGLTTYYGQVLGARAAMLTPEVYRAQLAATAAALDHRPGRAWRNLQDTADAAPASYFSQGSWASWRRGTDFYDEDWLNWLWADVIIRQQTGGAKSLDDFCRLFHGGQTTGPKVVPYEFTDVIAALNQVAPYDWKAFWTERLTNHGPGAPLAGIENSGWKLTYSDTPEETRHKEDSHPGVYSLGLLLDKDGQVGDTIEGMIAAKAGIGPGMKVIAVNGRHFSQQVLKDALAAGKTSKEPIELLVENVEYYKTFKLDYHEGEKYPHLTRDESKPDLLTPTINALK